MFGIGRGSSLLLNAGHKYLLLQTVKRFGQKVKLLLQIRSFAATKNVLTDSG